MDLFSRADQTDDESLIAGFAMGDEQAATAFIRRFQNPVYGMAIAVTRDRGLAEDVSQEVFVRAWRAAGNYDARRASVLTWLLTITRNAAIDAIRTKRPSPMGEDLLNSVLNASQRNRSAEETAVLAIESRRAAERLDTLPREQARAVALAVMGGCTAVEVSERENIPVGTAKTRIRTGLNRLREALKEERHG